MLEAINRPGAAWPGASTGTLAKGYGFFESSGHVGADEAEVIAMVS